MFVLRRQLVTAEGAHGAATSATGHRMTMMSARAPAQFNTGGKAALPLKEYGK